MFFVFAWSDSTGLGTECRKGEQFLVVLLLDCLYGIMATGCCGTKKQKLNNSSSVPSCNGTSVSNQMVALPEMCFFCFDVLYCHLYNLSPPKTPFFTNDA